MKQFNNLNLIMSKKGYIYVSIFIIIFLTSFLLRFLTVQYGNFPFTMDQARDMLDIRNIVNGLHPTLIGPTTSINGVFLGPFWYYFNVPAYIIGHGNPTALMYWNMAWYLVAGILLWLIHKKINPIFALISASIFLMAPALYFPSRYSWSANPSPYFTTFYFIALFFALKKPDFKKSLLVGLLCGLTMQIEAAFGILLFPVAFSLFLFKKSGIKNLASLFLGFFITLLPQIFFEFRHGFVMTKTFLSEVSGSSAILGDKLTFSESTLSHFESFKNIIPGIFRLDTDLALCLFIAAFGYLAYKLFKGKLEGLSKDYFIYSAFFIIFAFIFYLFYPHHLKGWYLLGLNIPFLIIIAAFFAEIFKLKLKIIPIIFIVILGLSFYNTTLNQMQFIPKSESERSTDRSNFRNQVEVIDWVYKKANGEAFKAYNYIPSVYDFPYNYLYWWHGTKTYGYQPDTLTYMDGVPEYIVNNEKFLTKKKKADENSKIFLIMETDENQMRRDAWLGSYVKYCLEESYTFSWTTEVQIRKVCKPE